MTQSVSRASFSVVVVVVVQDPDGLSPENALGLRWDCLKRQRDRRTGRDRQRVGVAGGWGGERDRET